MSNIVDVKPTYSQVDFFQHIPDGHLLKDLSLQVALMCKIPKNSVFLSGITVISSMMCRKWCVNYEITGRLPLGLYAIIEQPSGTAKSRVVEFFQKPFFEHQREVANRLKKAAVRADNESREAIQADDKKELALAAKEAQAAYLSACTTLFVSNSTPEAMEGIMTQAKGQFAAISSEQGLLDSLVAGMYSNKGSKKNNDMLLAGYTGGYVAGSRVGREAFVGRAIGGVLAFAQAGSIETILAESKGTGLAERFIFLREPHLLGTRDHFVNPSVDYDLIQRYHDMCEFIGDIIENPRECNELICLELSKPAFKAIAAYRNRLESQLADGGKFASSNLRGMVSKIDMLIMKFAALLHLTSGGDVMRPINDKMVRAAIGIAGELIESGYEAAMSNGHIGDKSEFDSILSLFENDQRPRNERNIIINKCKSLPFKNYPGNKSDAVRMALAKMVMDGVLNLSYLPTATGSQVKIYSLA